jgi:2-polyprenyl-3-methyl-5-hydroxy-6-metoxy-1,4-benzoquinol methylase
VYDISGRSIVDGAKSIGLDQTGFEDFNLIICSNVLEHVAAPAEVLNDIATKMANDAILYIEVPHEPIMMGDTDLVNLATRKKHWHEHINFFSETALRVMLRECELEAIEMEHVECDVYGRTGTQFFIACQRYTK